MKTWGLDWIVGRVLVAGTLLSLMSCKSNDRSADVAAEIAALTERSTPEARKPGESIETDPTAVAPDSDSEPTAAELANTITHVVKSGDSLWKIAHDNDTYVTTLRRLNGLSGDKIIPGQKILVPVKEAAADPAPEGATLPTPVPVPVQPAPVEAPRTPATIDTENNGFLPIKPREPGSAF